ncbi:MAG: glycoside hydrolase family 31 protein, partial [Longimicrobiales bacterium]|nr:glycoside hydrolase family 31 protein [Longimicrobiales bacterium]
MTRSARAGLRLLPALLFGALLAAPLAAQEFPGPSAAPEAVVSVGQARFTVLTDRLIRMEWSADGRFEDRATLVALSRRLPVPSFQVAREVGWTTLSTGALTLRYRDGSGRFTPENLEVRVATGGVDTTWRPGIPATGNLGATIRTLDGVKGRLPLGEGLVSRDGWALVDDSGSPLLAGDPAWVEPRPAGERQDWYFLGYGHAYRDAVGDFARVSGPMPVPPRFAFGTWWSRYWAYTDAEFMELVEDFDRHGVPLDVLVVDMDWHNTFELRWEGQERDAAGQPKGWTGYTWNPAFFPDPVGFLAWVHERGLEVPLNLHPASGIQPWETQYPDIARALGVDPATRAWIPFRIEERRFHDAYFEHVIRPLERQGVDFWWLDWQQWGDTQIPGLSPTMWLNHVFFTDMERQGRARPLIFHRFGGLGSHRYQVGFSGDAASTWDILAFEPEFTSTAANVLYGFWSHDIGGHLPGPVTPELYTRWIQFGALSPVLRTHTTKNPDAERRIWAYPPEHFEAMRAAMLLRTELVPYLYTAARQAHDTGVSMLRPLYYHWPEEDAAYAHMGQYMLGEDLLVAPVTTPADSATGLATVSLWLPPGDWVEWGSGARLHGPATVERTYLLDEIPLFARAGAVIPMAEPALRVGAADRGPLVLTVFPGTAGQAGLYEDAGNDTGYLRGESARTVLLAKWSEGGRRVSVAVGAAQGSYPGQPAERSLTVRVPGVLPPTAVTADGAPVPYRADGTASGWRYDGTGLAVEVRLPAAPVGAGRSVELTFPAADPALVDGAPGRLTRVRAAVDVLEGLWPVE